MRKKLRQFNHRGVAQWKVGDVETKEVNFINIIQIIIFTGLGNKYQFFVCISLFKEDYVLLLLRIDFTYLEGSIIKII